MFKATGFEKLHVLSKKVKLKKDILYYAYYNQNCSLRRVVKMRGVKHVKTTLLHEKCCLFHINNI